MSTSGDPPIHPIASVFQVLSDDLALLADDIATNGLLQPIELD